MLNLVDIDIDNMNGNLTIEVSYYHLKEECHLGDETSIGPDVELRQITKSDENGLFCFETMENAVKRVFWAHSDKVIHKVNRQEDWESSDFRIIEKYLFDNWV